MADWHKKTLNGVELAYLSRGEGPLVVLIHGFPDTAEAFEFALEPLAEAGYRAVSLETRGYPPSGLSSGNDYSLPTLARDVSEFITALGLQKAVVVGHDWGAVIGAATAAYFPDRLAGLVLVGFPHISRAKVTIGALLQRPHHLLFQFGAFGRWLTARKDLAYLDRMVRVWAPNWELPPGYMERVKAALREPERLKAVLEYYVQIWQRRKDRAMLEILARPLAMPGLIIGGLDEPAFRQQWLRDSAGCFSPPAPVVLWPEVGHWPHAEAPDRFLARLLEFLAVASPVR